MYHLFSQEKLLNISIYIPKSYEINWELFIKDENERNLIKEIYEKIDNIDDINNYKKNNPDIEEKIYQKLYSIYKCGIRDKYLKYDNPSIIDEFFKSDNITRITFIAFGLLFFYGKIIFEYFE